MHVPANEKLAIAVELLTLAVLGWVLNGLLGTAGISIAGIALVPAILCLGIIWLFFAIRLVAKLFLLAKGGHADPDTRTPFAADTPVDVPSFDADAAFANYMTKRAENPPPVVEEVPAAAPVRPQFGRKTV